MSGDPIRAVAELLERRGLALPGRLLADAHRPLAPLLADVGAALGPLLGVAVGDRADGARHLLEDRTALDRLVDELDRRAGGGADADPS